MPRDRRRKGVQHPQHVAPITQERREAVQPLAGQRKRKVKELRDLGWSYADIADAVHCTELQVADALGNSRADNPASPHASIFTRKSTVARFLAHALPDETAHETLERLLDEYEYGLGMLADSSRREGLTTRPPQ